MILGFTLLAIGGLFQWFNGGEVGVASYVFYGLFAGLILVMVAAMINQRMKG